MHNMKLHDILHPDIKQNVEIIRVPGGWIYNIFTGASTPDNTNLSSVFVPFDMEFKTNPPKSEQGDSKNSSQAVQHLKAEIAAMQKVLDSDEAKGKYKISIVVVNNWLRQLSAVE